MSHVHEKIDFTASVYIVYEGKILLHQHTKTNYWLPVGGHIELDEDPNEAILREAKEECGLEIELLDIHKTKVELKDYDTFKSLIAPAFLNIHSITPTHQHTDLVYFATSKTARFIPEYEGMILKWFTKEELRSNPDIAESIIFFSEKAMAAANSKE